MAASKISSSPENSHIDQDPDTNTPGKLRGDARIVIQTRQAQKLVKGRERRAGVEPIIGMLAFGQRMKPLWTSSQNDDPYADWYLLQIEQCIDAAQKQIQEKRQWLSEVLEGMDGIKIDVASSRSPIEIPLQFSNPYGYMGAYLVADYDALTRTILTTRHFGLIDRNRSEELLKNAGRAIRRSFNTVGLWKYTGVRRQDFDPINQTALRAKELMGEIPEEILSGSLRAKIAPKRQADLSD